MGGTANHQTAAKPNASRSISPALASIRTQFHNRIAMSTKG
jgi:hypothetical protein